MKTFARGLAVLLIAISLAPLVAVPFGQAFVNHAEAWGRFPGGHHPAYHPHWTRPGCVGCGVGAAAVAGIVGGVVLGAAIAGSQPYGVVVAPPAPMPSMQVAALPPGCTAMNIYGTQYYQCGSIWYQPFFGGNGVYYVVVPAP